MRTDQRLASLASLTNPQDLPKFWRGKATSSQVLDYRLIHWDVRLKMAAEACAV